MSDCFIFTQGPTSGAGAGEVNLIGYAQDSSSPYPLNWTCNVLFKDNATVIQTKILACVKEVYLLQNNVVIGLPGDKVTYVPGFS